MRPRAPLSAFAGERLPGIGHNQGPPIEAGHTWRKHVWTKARKELMPRLPLEVLRRRVKRATELGLEYPAYASILLGTGRDIVGFLFTCEAIGARLGRGEIPDQLPAPVASKLRDLIRCDRLLTGPAKDSPAKIAAILADRDGIAFADTAPIPTANSANWSEGGAAIQAVLRGRKLPGDSVVMIGTQPHERTWADAARLARFIPSETYFGR